jgi:predicted MPP superfamily phosphohydrolase
MLLMFNMLMIGLDVAALTFVATFRSRLAIMGAFCVGLLAMLAVVAATGEGEFGKMRLICCGLFIHGPIVAVGLFLILVRTRRKEALAWLAIAALIAAVGVDAFYVEPHWLQVTHLTLRSPKITRPMRVALIADVQTDSVGQYERDLFARVMQEKPDLILFAGDYIQVDDSQWTTQRELFRKLLIDQPLDAPLGIYAVKGNTDPPFWEELFLGSNVTTFPMTTTYPAGEVQVTGLSEFDAKSPTTVVTATEAFQIVVGHYPDYALGDIQADLMLAGHTHGGQVQLPLIGPLITLSKVPRQWASGVTHRDGGRTLVVSRGAGMERGEAPRLRFLCRPELVVIDLAPE